MNSSKDSLDDWLTSNKIPFRKIMRLNIPHG